MATVTRVHPLEDGSAIKFFIGREECTIFSLDFGDDLSSAGTDGVDQRNDPTKALSKVLRIIADNAEVLVQGDLHSTNQVMDFIIGHHNTADTYDGTNSETMVQNIEDQIQALGDLSGSSDDEIDYTSVALTVKTSFNLT